MNEVQENVSSRFGPKTKVIFTTSPGIREHASCSAVCICNFGPNSRKERMADPDGSSQSRVASTNLRLRKSELAEAWEDVSLALRGFYELADILIVLDEVFLLEISNFARQLTLSPTIGDDHLIISHLTASLWF